MLKKKGILKFAFPKSVISLPTNVNRNVICFSSSSSYFSSTITTKYSLSQDSVATHLSLSSSASPPSIAASNSHNSNVTFSEFYSLHSKTGHKVSSNKQQLLFCLRYVDNDEDICEDFVKFIHCKSGLTGKDLYNEVTETLSSFGLDLQNCCGQGYDGAGAVYGHVDGISALMLRENSKALYTHCASHRLNLVIGTSCKISSVRNLMEVIKDISYFFNFSPIRAEHLQNLIKKYEQGRTKCKLIDVCRTRWISRIDGLDVFEELFTYVVETLEYFSVNPESTINRDTSIKAQALLLTHISNFNFIVSLVITRKIFDLTHSVTALLQAKSNDIVNGFELIGSLIDLMPNIRVNIDRYHDEWYSEACKLAQKINVNESVLRTCAR